MSPPLSLPHLVHRRTFCSHQSFSALPQAWTWSRGYLKATKLLSGFNTKPQAQATTVIKAINTWDERIIGSIHVDCSVTPTIGQDQQVSESARGNWQVRGKFMPCRLESPHMLTTRGRTLKRRLNFLAILDLQFSGDWVHMKALGILFKLGYGCLISDMKWLIDRPKCWWILGRWAQLKMVKKYPKFKVV